MAEKVYPIREVFEAICHDKTLERFAPKLGIDLGTLTKLRRGQQVSRRTIQTVAANLRRPVRELIHFSREQIVPTDPNFFERIQYGWFIDNDVYSGAGQWFSEDIRLQLVPDSPPDRPAFTGELTNCFGGQYAVTGQRLEDYLFVLIAVGQRGAGSFCASLVTHHSGVLCGVWSGVNHIGKASVYRTCFAGRKLNLSELMELAAQVEIEAWLATDQAGSGFSGIVAEEGASPDAEPGAAADGGGM